MSVVISPVDRSSFGSVKWSTDIARFRFRIADDSDESIINGSVLNYKAIPFNKNPILPLPFRTIDGETKFDAQRL